tara:strand:+ start:2417 stop:2932 length:516 start_codon:yes stop_codon:yes gene_type:complete
MTNSGNSLGELANDAQHAATPSYLLELIAGRWGIKTFANKSLSKIDLFPLGRYNRDALSADWNQSLKDAGEDSKSQFLFLHPPKDLADRTIEKALHEGVDAAILCQKQQQVRKHQYLSTTPIPGSMIFKGYTNNLLSNLKIVVVRNGKHASDTIEAIPFSKDDHPSICIEQ